MAASCTSIPLGVDSTTLTINQTAMWELSNAYENATSGVDAAWRNMRSGLWHLELVGDAAAHVLPLLHPSQFGGRMQLPRLEMLRLDGCDLTLCTPRMSGRALFAFLRNHIHSQQQQQTYRLELMMCYLTRGMMSMLKSGERKFHLFVFSSCTFKSSAVVCAQ
jgi:hypothetical protein